MVQLHGHLSSMPRLEELGIEPVADLAFIEGARGAIAGLRASDELLAYVVDLVRATREHPALLAGASPRATNMLTATARARAALEGRDYVVPDDVKALAPFVLAHRLVLSPAAQIDGTSAEKVVEQVLKEVPAPR